MEINRRRLEFTTVASFPKGSFLENFIVRSDNSLLVTSLKSKELWYVPPPDPSKEVQPRLLCSFEQAPMSLVEPMGDVFYLSTTDGYNTHASSLYRIDLRHWKSGDPVKPQAILSFPSAVRALNGSCLIGPRTILIADCFASLILRVDLSDDGFEASPSIWLKHYSMLYHPGEMQPEQPGVNAVRFAPELSYVYYTATALKLFMRVRVDPETLAPLSAPEYVGGGIMMDDFCIDETKGVAYVTTHRENTIEVLSLEPGKNQARVTLAGNPFDPRLVGPSSAAWGRAAGDDRRVAFFSTDGGTTALPPDGVLRAAKILRAEI